MKEIHYLKLDDETDLKSLLKVLVLLKEHAIVDDDLGRGNTEINDAIIHCLGTLYHKQKQ